MKNKIVENKFLIGDNADFFKRISRGPTELVVKFFVEGVLREVMLMPHGNGKVAEALRSLVNLRLVDKRMKGSVYFYVNKSNIKYNCSTLLDEDKYVLLQVMYAVKYKLASDRFTTIEGFKDRGNKFDEVLKIGQYGIMLWACQFGIKRESEEGDEKVDSRLLAICDRERKKVEGGVGDFEELFEKKVYDDRNVPVYKIVLYKDNLKGFCDMAVDVNEKVKILKRIGMWMNEKFLGVKMRKGSDDVELNEKVRIFSKMVMRMIKEYEVDRKREKKKMKEEGK